MNSDVASLLVVASSGLSGAISGGSGSGNLIGDLVLVIDQLLLFVGFSRHIYEVFERWVFNCRSIVFQANKPKRYGENQPGQQGNKGRRRGSWCKRVVRPSRVSSPQRIPESRSSTDEILVTDSKLKYRDADG
jgi:hypothetical protein